MVYDKEGVYLLYYQGIGFHHDSVKKKGGIYPPHSLFLITYFRVYCRRFICYKAGYLPRLFLKQQCLRFNIVLRCQLKSLFYFCRAKLTRHFLMQLPRTMKTDSDFDKRLFPIWANTDHASIECGVRFRTECVDR